MIKHLVIILKLYHHVAIIIDQLGKTPIERIEIWAQSIVQHMVQNSFCWIYEVEI